jgi:hypothetical protein
LSILRRQITQVRCGWCLCRTELFLLIQHETETFESSEQSPEARCFKNRLPGGFSDTNEATD